MFESYQRESNKSDSNNATLALTLIWWRIKRNAYYPAALCAWNTQRLTNIMRITVCTCVKPWKSIPNDWKFTITGLLTNLTFSSLSGLKSFKPDCYYKGLYTSSRVVSAQLAWVWIMCNSAGEWCCSELSPEIYNDINHAGVYIIHWDKHCVTPRSHLHVKPSHMNRVREFARNNRTWLYRGSYGVYVAIIGWYSRKFTLWNMEWIFTLFVTEITPWGVTSVITSFGSSEPAEIPLVEKWIFTLLELESSEIHSSTDEISTLHGRSELFTRFFFLENTNLEQWLTLEF